MNEEERKEPIAYDAYEKLADAYAAKVDTKPHNAYYDRPAMLSLLPEIEGLRVLDAGCGPGSYSIELLKRGARSVVGIDMSPTMLKLAKRRIEEAVGFKQMQLLKMDMSYPLDAFKDSSFDLVNAPLCMDYIRDWNALYAEFFRILKPGGYFLFSCGHPASDAQHFKTKKYFSVEKVDCVWGGFGIDVRMPSYRRSMEEIFMPVINAGFVIDRVHEPLPVDKFRRTDFRRYHELMHRPVFMCLRARRPE